MEDPGKRAVDREIRATFAAPRRAPDAGARPHSKKFPARAADETISFTTGMKLANPSTVPVYTVAGASTARPLPEWLARKRKRSLKKDPEYANRVELLQDFEFDEASCCVRASEDGEWVMSTGSSLRLCPRRLMFARLMADAE
jgi:hypothetical protein